MSKIKDLWQKLKHKIGPKADAKKTSSPEDSSATSGLSETDLFSDAYGDVPSNLTRETLGENTSPTIVNLKLDETRTEEAKVEAQTIERELTSPELDFFEKTQKTIRLNELKELLDSDTSNPIEEEHATSSFSELRLNREEGDAPEDNDVFENMKKSLQHEPEESDLFDQLSATVTTGDGTKKLQLDPALLNNEENTGPLDPTGQFQLKEMGLSRDPELETYTPSLSEQEELTPHFSWKHPLPWISFYFKHKLKKIFPADNDEAADGPTGQDWNSFEWSKIFDYIFSPRARGTTHRLFFICFVLCFSYILGKSLALFLVGKTPLITKVKKLPVDLGPGVSSSDLELIRRNDPFKSLTRQSENGKKKVIDENIPCLEADRLSTLPLKLINTIVLQDSVKSVAAVQVSSTPELVEYREGEKIDGMAKVDRIDRLKVIFKNLQSGDCEFITNGSEEEVSQPATAYTVVAPKPGKKLLDANRPKGISSDGNNYKISKKLLQEKMSNLESLLSEARGIKVPNPDGSMSFKIVEVEPGGLFSYLGIQNDDMITAINGKPITNMNEVMNLFGKMKDLSKLNLNIKREGLEQELNYNIQSP